jgi:hypothetical protein
MNLRTLTWFLVAGGTSLALGACGGVSETGLGSTEICTNGVDDDGDGQKDCADPDCAGHAACRASVEAFCDNGADDDDDGLVDCADPDCGGHQACVGDREVDCANGVDDDGDGVADCQDADCLGQPACLEICGDGEDNDLDGAADCDDADCRETEACLITGQEWCANGQDDDGDGLVDCQDPDCDTALTCRLPPERCDNGWDDDGDGWFDCDDPDCFYSPYCVEYGCLDGRDDDGDGLVDCQDDDCAGLPECWTNLACEPAEWIGCGAQIVSTTVGRLNNFLEYPCTEGNGFGGPERYFTFTAMETTIVVVGLQSLGSTPLTLLALGSDDNTAGCSLDQRCVVGTSSGVEGQRLELVVQAGQTVYLVVDGASNTGDAFGLTVECLAAPQEICGNGEDDDDDGAVDCWDWDCAVDATHCGGWTGAGYTCLSPQDCAPGEDCLFSYVPNTQLTEGMCTKPCLTEGLVPACAETVTGVGTCRTIMQTTVKRCVLGCGTQYGNASCPLEWRCVDAANGSTTEITNGICVPE